VYFTPNVLASGPSGPYTWFGTLAANGGGSTGMLYKRNRYFDPVSGRFTQQDPIGLAGGLNLYGFADGDPVNFSDPFGLSKCPPACDEVFEQLSQLAPAMERELATFLPRNAVAAIGGNAIGAGISRLLGAIAARIGSRSVTHFTSIEGAAAIESSGALRQGSFVVPANEVAGMSARTAEYFLEIGAGRGAMQATFRVPADALRVPFNGPVTSGGATQFQVTRPLRVSSGTFTPTP
jgi:RHS repeat-associated protein